MLLLFFFTKPSDDYNYSAPPPPIDLDLPPPPPSLLLNSPPADTPTEMLENSLKNLKINQKDGFNKEAGKVLSMMLESRMKKGDTLPKKINNYKANGVQKEEIPPPLPKSPPPALAKFNNLTEIIINTSPIRSPGTPPPSFIASTFPTETHFQTIEPQMLTEEPKILKSVGKLETIKSTNGRFMENSPKFETNEPIRRHQSSQDSNNPNNHKSTIRKSLIFESQTNGTIKDEEKVTVNGGNTDERREADDRIIKSIACEMNENGVEPICCVCNRKIQR